MKTGCATLVAINKWDLGAVLDLKEARRPTPLADPPAPAGDRVLGEDRARGDEAARARRRRSPTAAPSGSRPPTSTGCVADVVAKRPPPQRRGKRLRLYYAAQVGRRPPRIAIQVNDRRLITRDWAYYLENRFRDAYELEGVPLVIDFIPKKRRARARERAPV